LLASARGTCLPVFAVASCVMPPAKSASTFATTRLALPGEAPSCRSGRNEPVPQASDTARLQGSMRWIGGENIIWGYGAANPFKFKLPNCLDRDRVLDGDGGG
jgi:hypothetical protein